MTDDNNLPGNEPGPDVTTAAPDSYEDQVAGLADILGDPVSDLPEDDQAHDDEAAEVQTTEDDDDPLGLNVEQKAEDVGEADAEETDGSEGPEIKGGRFAPDSAKVTLDDGTVITVADLKRNNLFQRDYTKKTTELKAEREALDAKVSEVSQRAQSLDQFQEYAAWYAENYLPKQPKPYDGPKDDYVAFLQWQQDYADWERHAQAYQQFLGQKTTEGEKKQQEAQQQVQQRLEAERDALVKAIPVLKDPVKGKQTWDAIRSGAIEHYGLTAEEFDTIGDHRILVGLRDALAYRRIKAKAPQVQAQVAAKPAMKPSRRQPAQAAASKEKQVRSERLRATGRMDAAVESLMDFDL